MRLMLWKREFKEKPEIVLSREMNGRMVKGHITNKIGESAVDVSIEEFADLHSEWGCLKTCCKRLVVKRIVK
jgi:hypothetical protein